MTVRAMQEVGSTDGGWDASLDLHFDSTPIGTRLASRRHRGPLVVQRALYPEGPQVCHAIVVHPPGGIAGGDVLHVDVSASGSAHALLTTPGASKLYKSAGRRARQRVRLCALDSACIEWLPQEAIVFDEADAHLALEIEVSAQASVIAWEIITLGREAMGERFASGRLRNHLTVRRDEALVVHEVGEVEGGSAWLVSPVGWRNARASGTFVVVGAKVGDDVLDGLGGALESFEGRAAVSQVSPELLVARYLGASATEAREAFAALWSLLRPAATGRHATRPRIWST